ncbi:MAG: hypothetical protein WC557_05455 [Ignavibacteriaceae bacterium]
MKTYEVLLSRSYVVTIQARNEEEASRQCEFYIGEERDLSTEAEKEIEQFEIQKIEMRINDASEVRKLGINE